MIVSSIVPPRRRDKATQFGGLGFALFDNRHILLLVTGFETRSQIKTAHDEQKLRLLAGARVSIRCERARLALRPRKIDGF